eukprot:CAMPEP_0194026130 /NCGR_PEP_ID=MMETSP0009_2-20130614/455_1 /TAXON_ID=210454 /ORGANISM="Grammatophora oceanica, Strain CCMP 410" /LENGTH=193 /DNA_ID=CAMNT_0038664671 /DNA_START=122 /DNA_END=703 /DNA_ORIENTATION=-
MLLFPNNLTYFFFPEGGMIIAPYWFVLMHPMHAYAVARVWPIWKWLFPYLFIMNTIQGYFEHYVNEAEAMSPVPPGYKTCIQLMLASFGPFNMVYMVRAVVLAGKTNRPFALLGFVAFFTAVIFNFTTKVGYPSPEPEQQKAYLADPDFSCQHMMNHIYFYILMFYMFFVIPKENLPGNEPAATVEGADKKEK